MASHTNHDAAIETALCHTVSMTDQRPPDLSLHEQNMARLRRTLFGYTILKIGLLALVAVLLWRLFGQG